MFRFLRKKNLSHLSSFVYSHCDDEDTSDLIQQADEAIEKDKLRIKSPLQFDSVKNVVSQGTVNSYDGLRVVVQKQLNLNTVVSHFYWVGSQMTGQPIYQYRLILPFDENMVNVATDMDFNVEGECRYSVLPNLISKANFVIGDQATGLTCDLEYTGDNFTAGLQMSRIYQQSLESTASISFMQGLTPYFSMGGLGKFTSSSQDMTMAFAALYEEEEHSIIALWDSDFKLLYMRKVNPNRVHLTTDLTIDASGNSQMSLAAEFILKQSKLNMSVDSNLQLRSVVETGVVQGVQLQFCAEMNQNKNHYRFGYGLIMG